MGATQARVRVRVRVRVSNGKAAAKGIQIHKSVCAADGDEPKHTHLHSTLGRDKSSSFFALYFIHICKFDFT